MMNGGVAPVPECEIVETDGGLRVHLEIVIRTRAQSTASTAAPPISRCAAERRRSERVGAAAKACGSWAWEREWAWGTMMF
jgi:hypothetical protein